MSNTPFDTSDETRTLSTSEKQQLKDLFRSEIEQRRLSYRNQVYKLRQHVLESKWLRHAAYDSAKKATQDLIERIHCDAKAAKSTREINTSKKTKQLFKSAGCIGNIPFESVIYQKSSAFLTYHEQFSIQYQLELNDVTLRPLEASMFPYRPYTLTEKTLKALNSWNPEKQAIYDEVHNVFETFLDLEPQFKMLEAIQTLETYHQHKLMTTSYLYHCGDNESGKTRALELHSYLDCRPLMSPSLPAADVFTYLGHHDDGSGTILEDEAENLNHPRSSEKMKIYR